jgi:hypothetical protein
LAWKSQKAAMFEGSYMRKCNKYVNLIQESKDMWRLEEAINKPTVISEAGTIPHSVV